MINLDLENVTLEINNKKYGVVIHKDQEDDSVDSIETKIKMVDFNDSDELFLDKEKYHPNLYITLEPDWDLSDWFLIQHLGMWVYNGVFSVFLEGVVNDKNRPSEISESFFGALVDNAVQLVNEKSILSIRNEGDLLLELEFIPESHIFDLKAVLALMESDLREIQSEIKLNGTKTLGFDLSDPNLEPLLKENISLFREIERTCKTFQTAEISVERIICFLQFEDVRQVKVIIKLLGKIEFLNSSRINHLIRNSYLEINETYKKNALLLPLGTGQDSSSVVGYTFFKELNSNENESLNNIGELGALGRELLSNSYTSIVFIDDNITSGTQLYEFFTELIQGAKEPEMVKSKLTDLQYEKLKTIPIFVCYAIQLTRECEKKVQQIREEFSLNLTVCSPKVDFNNYLDFSSSTMESMDEAKFAQGFIGKISKRLYEDKDWDEKKLYHRLLGYGNLGKLTVFYYNVPKSLIPVFWKYGQYKFKKWIPLFPERSEKLKIEGDQAEFRNFDREFAQKIIRDNE